MAPFVSDLVERARLTARAIADFGENLVRPTIRIGVTGLSRAGKTVFITALVHGLARGGRFPVFTPLADDTILRAYLAPQPDDAVPRFDYESHVRALVGDRVWPDSTRQISELRVVIEHKGKDGQARTLTLDIVDYPGEWLLDLPLLDKTYEQWAKESLALSRAGPRAMLAASWHAYNATLDPNAPADEQVAITAAQLYTDYLRSCREERWALSLLPPGRFLLPGDLAGSPALTFAPLALPAEAAPPEGSLWAMMKRRFDAYKDIVIRPFFRDHFARLDRQIVLVDVLAALNAGPAAVRDLEFALASILDCFQVGRRTLLSSLISPRVDRVLFAATKADHLHQVSHDRLEAILGRMIERAASRARYAGAETDVVALAAVRATREARVRSNGDELPAIVGVPAAGERAAGHLFDGEREIALFPGDLPADPERVFDVGRTGFQGLAAASPEDAEFRFLRFRPPRIERTVDGMPTLPHIRLDRVLQFLIGDRFQ
ncbi:YcjX family protein [Rhodoplanes roseus]|uniref:Amino acid regulated cytosolic protein n=1 Tax=Rhodoplanes roseus TaxID=29409 RepID=A0A327KY07_9BRAD|nr:YcjX family protein [Rhodoplanes roseus]RAI42966.1 amino acid regulated cytosolic protein [Rhodoplanes roseus]